MIGANVAPTLVVKEFTVIPRTRRVGFRLQDTPEELPGGISKLTPRRMHSYRIFKDKSCRREWYTGVETSQYN